MENEILIVEGMKCPKCSGRINESLGSTPGVTSVEADHEAGTVDVTYDPSLVSLGAIKSIIEALDFVVVA